MASSYDTTQRKSISIYRMSDPQPNWEQNDPSQPDYIKNRELAQEVRPILVNGEIFLDAKPESGPVNFVAGRNVYLATDGNAIVISAIDAASGGDAAAIVAGDGINITLNPYGEQVISVAPGVREDTTYSFVLNETGNGIIITPFLNGEPIYTGPEDAPVQEQTEIVLPVYTKTETNALLSAIVGLIGEAATETQPASGVYAYIDSAIAAALGGTDATVSAIVDEAIAEYAAAADEKFATIEETRSYLTDVYQAFDVFKIETNSRLDTNEKSIRDISSYLASWGGHVSDQISTLRADVDSILDIIDDIQIGTIPPATADSLGGVKSTEDTPNKIAVEQDGTMTVRRITTDILEEGTEELIFSGGGSLGKATA